MRAPITYISASEQQKALICNGCGTKGLGGWLVPDTLYGLNITEECNIHDWMYHEGETQEDKDHADLNFYHNILDKIEQGYRIFKWLRRMRAKKYYLAVKLWGDTAFWAGK